MGYNAVRLHHFDDLLVRKTERSSVELDPARADQLDYLFYCLEQRGSTSRPTSTPAACW